MAKLSADQVRYIRSTYRKGQRPSLLEIANEIGVSMSLVSQVARNVIWKHLDERNA